MSSAPEQYLRRLRKHPGMFDLGWYFCDCAHLFAIAAHYNPRRPLE
jgi:hypothetical protein